MAKKKYADPATYELESKLRAARRELKDMRGQLQLVDEMDAELYTEEPDEGSMMDLQEELKQLGLGAITAATIGGIRASAPAYSDVAVPVASGALYVVGLVAGMPTLADIGRTGALLAIADASENALNDWLDKPKPSAEAADEL